MSATIVPDRGTVPFLVIAAGLALALTLGAVGGLLSRVDRIRHDAAAIRRELPPIRAELELCRARNPKD